MAKFYLSHLAELAPIVAMIQQGNYTLEDCSRDERVLSGNDKTQQYCSDCQAKGIDIDDMVEAIFKLENCVEISKYQPWCKEVYPESPVYIFKYQGYYGKVCMFYNRNILQLQMVIHD